jgi:TM2 domain-containing membrane protein YozV
MSQIPTSPSPGGVVPPYNQEEVHNKKIVAGILGIVLNGFGAHRFYLGDTQGGIIRLLLTCVCVGSIISLVEGIMYLTKTDEQFYQEYIVQKKPWF